ncbi:hypothetical protein SLEP1_g48040 [Rubroshorea leprosula]|uniref:Uncharacterized protein n=1 Tax=Rubroshorea leprosula TaxID=152421 RepID=A0AAV5LSD9_9ROSI|nr:hypothetical protein SLEP1_g48040 [Rubroshorea leprosula]
METQKKGTCNGVFLGCPGNGKGTYSEPPVEARNLPP